MPHTPEQKRQWRLDRAKKGLCQDCGGPLFTKALCKECGERTSLTMRNIIKRIKELCYEKYGGYKCNCCGIVEPAFLTIDHKNNDGAAHRKNDRGAYHLYRWLIKNNFPDGFQILCYNCNWAKSRHGICPHQRKRKITNNDFFD